MRAISVIVNLFALVAADSICGNCLEPPPAYAVSQSVEQFAAFFPAYATIGDADAIGQRLARHQILATGFEMAFCHDAENPVITIGNLAAHILPHIHLAFRLLAAVAVTEIDHDACRNSGLGKTAAGSIHTGGVVIGFLATAQDQVTVLIPGSRDDRGMPGLGHRQKMVGGLGCADRINGDLDVAISAILEPDRAGQP